MNLYISNLSPETTEQDLEKIFSEFGAIKSLKIIIDRETNVSKGYGFVEMEDKAAGYDAVDYLDMSYLKGNIVNVREAKNNKDGAPTNKRRTGPPQQRDNRPRNNFSRERNYNRDSNSNSYNRDNSGYNRDNNYNRENSGYNRENSGYNKKHNSDADYNNDLSYNA